MQFKYKPERNLELEREIEYIKDGLDRKFAKLEKDMQIFQGKGWQRVGPTI